MSTPRSDLPQPDAIVFDLDGTLVDTVEHRIESWMRVFDEQGIAAERRHVAELIGSDGKRLAREVASVTDAPMDERRAEEADRRSGEHYDELNIDPRPLTGAQRLLEALETSPVKWAIATSSRKEQTTASVAALGLAVPPRIVDGSHVAHAKPAPDLLLQAAEELGVEPQRTWYVGDATWDMQAAVAAGMPAIGVTTGAVDAEALRSAGAQVVVGSLDELYDLAATAGVVQPG